MSIHKINKATSLIALALELPNVRYGSKEKLAYKLHATNNKATDCAIDYCQTKRSIINKDWL